MIRASIYARYSTDRQAESSIDDQIRVCRAVAQTAGWAVVAIHSDSAMSGSTQVESRPGGTQMLDDALSGRFDVLVLEGLDRLSRDQVEQERIVRRLEHRGVRIVGASDGYDSTMGARKVLRGVRGLINEMYLDDLREKTHRGQSGQVSRGFVAGGKSYGYDLVRSEHGTTYKINEEEARWVRWIFKGFAEGQSAQRLAHELNRLKVPSPRNSTWAVSAIYGSPAKGSGILNNSLYAGQYIWNRSKWVKEPDTGKRTRLDRPREEWQIVAVPHLRIVEDDLWQAVRSRIDTGRDQFGRKNRGRPSATLFGGLLVCPHCNGAVVAVNASLYGCAANKDRGPTVCQGVHVRRDLVDKRLLSVVRDDLLSNSAASRFEELFRQAVKRRLAGRDSERSAIEARIKKINQEVGRLVDAIASMGGSESLVQRLRIAEAALSEEKEKLLHLPSAVEIPVPPIGAIYRRVLMNLSEHAHVDTAQTRAILADILGPVRLDIEQEGQVWAEMKIGRTVLFDRVDKLGCGSAQPIYLQQVMETLPSIRVRLK